MSSFCISQILLRRPSSIHPSIIFNRLSCLGLLGLDPLPANLGEEAGSTLNRLLAYVRGRNQ
ncbi:hypothetical protein EXN66_Car014518 [Channa argus]|uniref:Uncharacterized protein n=1 Tax=Channa argus TaxID=215402 RepID=A0A6G1Q876_CHAAH|nr:hypothetical protein EXN66_Car014518 [Channa argus]